MNFVSYTRKTAHTNVVTSKYVIMIRNKYFYDFYPAVSAAQVNVERLIMIICQRRS